MNRQQRINLTRDHFRRYLMEQLSLRDLALLVEVPKSTLARRFRQYIARDYVRICRGNGGTLGLIVSYLSRPEISRRQKREIRRWLDANLGRLLTEDVNSERSFHSDERLKRLSYTECFLEIDIREKVDSNYALTPDDAY